VRVSPLTDSPSLGGPDDLSGLDPVAAAVLETMATTRAMRDLRADPVPRALVERIIWAATRAPSPHNTQCWDFVVVDDAPQRARIGELFGAAAGARTSSTEGGAQTAKGLDLMTRIAAAPVIVFVCGVNVYPPDAPDPVYMYSAIYAAAQNLVLAARALGLGATFTAFHRADEDGVRALLGIPDDRTIGVTIPLGWPARPFGRVRRRPVTEVLHRNTW
jgi:nitroreductase